MDTHPAAPRLIDDPLSGLYASQFLVSAAEDLAPPEEWATPAISQAAGRSPATTRGSVTTQAPVLELGRVERETPATVKTQALEWEAATSAAIVELMGKLAEAADLQTGCLAVAHEVARHVDCDRVAIAVAGKRGGQCRLIAVSGIVAADRRCELTRELEAALNEAALQGSVVAWPGAHDDPPHASLAHRRLCQATGNGGVVGAPLRASDGTIVGAWVLLGTEDLARRSDHRQFLEACAQPVGSWLALLRRHEPPAWLKPLRWLASSQWHVFRKAAWTIAVLAAAALWLPLPYRISTDFQLEPVTRRVVSAPYAGVFERSLVKPGEVVAGGQVLGCMDGREIRWELAGLSADRQRAEKSRDVNLAAGKVAAAQIDQLEMERLELKRRLLSNREENLEIKSPIDGVVLAGDLERSQGAPVTMGQTLYEIGPLDGMVAELAVADREISYVREGMPVRLRPDARPANVQFGVIARIHPRSETRDTDNVFIAEVVLDNPDAQLRPGMQGRAAVTADRRWLWWILFHEPWERVVSWLRW